MELDGTRRFVLRRFPFTIVYREAAQGIEVIAVAHAKRRTAYWRGR
jgi:toxin ParE1/3/4